jgi:hypothetical protein
MTRQLFAQLDDQAAEQLVGGKGKPGATFDQTNSAGNLRGLVEVDGVIYLEDELANQGWTVTDATAYDGLTVYSEPEL